jgi:hypothetical protein
MGSFIKQASKSAPLPAVQLKRGAKRILSLNEEMPRRSTAARQGASSKRYRTAFRHLNLSFSQLQYHSTQFFQRKRNYPKLQDA